MCGYKREKDRNEVGKYDMQTPFSNTYKRVSALIVLHFWQKFICIYICDSYVISHA
jgi:hypothetical protein